MKIFSVLILLFEFFMVNSLWAVQDVQVVKDDTYPYYRAQMQYRKGPIDLTGAVVYFTMAPVADSIVNSVTAKVYMKEVTVLSAKDGLVEYQWAVGDTDTVGKYNIRFKVVRGSVVFTKPTTEIARVVVIP